MTWLIPLSISALANICVYGIISPYTFTVILDYPGFLEGKFFRVDLSYNNIALIGSLCSI